MYALQMIAFGDPTEVIKLVDLPNPPAPSDDEALVVRECAPINTSVLLTIRDLYGMRPHLPAGVGNAGVWRVLGLGKAVTHKCGRTCRTRIA
jgi:NADPH:quinone reductase-like Zn-dependent oxidoreductase